MPDDRDPRDRYGYESHDYYQLVFESYFHKELRVRGLHHPDFLNIGERRIRQNLAGFQQRRGNRSIGDTSVWKWGRLLSLKRELRDIKEHRAKVNELAAVVKMRVDEKVARGGSPHAAFMACDFYNW